MTLKQQFNFDMLKTFKTQSCLSRMYSISIILLFLIFWNVLVNSWGLPIKVTGLCSLIHRPLWSVPQMQYTPQRDNRRLWLPQMTCFLICYNFVMRQTVLDVIPRMLVCSYGVNKKTCLGWFIRIYKTMDKHRH